VQFISWAHRRGRGDHEQHAWALIHQGHEGGTHRRAVIASFGLPCAAWRCPRPEDRTSGSNGCLATCPSFRSFRHARGNPTHPLLVACASHAVSPGSAPRLQSSSLSTPPEQAQPLAALAPNATSIHGVRSCKFHSNPIPIKLLFQDQEKRWKKKIICAGKEDGSC
jgi:hypothetical protein